VTTRQTAPVGWRVRLLSASLPPPVLAGAAGIALAGLARPTLDAAGASFAVSVALAFYARMNPRAGLLGQVAAGLGAAACFVLRPDAWVACAGMCLAVHAALGILPFWRGQPRRRGLIARDVLVFAVPALLLPLLLVAGGASTEGVGWAWRLLAAALPRRPVVTAVLWAFEALLAVLLLDGLRATRAPGRTIGWTLALAVLAMLGGRLAWLLSMATLPVEIFWPEAPFLVNALKLDLGAKLYGPPELLDSYTYSPLLDLLHHALLRPVHLELSLHANRAVAFGEQLLSAAILAWTLGPTVRQGARAGLSGAGSVWLGAALALASLLNLLAPAVHPDHGLLVCFAVAIALVAAEDRWRRPLWWAALIAVTPLSVAFKLTGAGIGAGLALAFLLERRWRETAVVAASGLAALATIPLFDATLGAFRFYAIDIQRAHVRHLERVVLIGATPIGAAACVALGAAAWLVATDPRRGMTRRFRCVAVVGAATSVSSLVGYLKTAGNENNLTFLAISAAVLLLFAAFEAHEEGSPRAHPAIGPAALTLALFVARPPEPPLVGAARTDVLVDEGVLERLVAEEGARALLLTQVAPWIAAGRRDVPPDRLQSATELDLAGHPAGRLLTAHLADGRYDALAFGPDNVRPVDPALKPLAARLEAVIESRYELVYPPADMRRDGVSHVFVYRRRAVPGAGP
jgi:hypothetical protein